MLSNDIENYKAGLEVARKHRDQYFPNWKQVLIED